MSKQMHREPKSFILMPNKWKKHSSQPDYIGTLMLEDGVLQDIAAWVKGSKHCPEFIVGKYNERAVREAIKRKKRLDEIDPNF